MKLLWSWQVCGLRLGNPYLPNISLSYRLHQDPDCTSYVIMLAEFWLGNLGTLKFWRQRWEDNISMDLSDWTWKEITWGHFPYQALFELRFLAVILLSWPYEYDQFHTSCSFKGGNFEPKPRRADSVSSEWRFESGIRFMNNILNGESPSERPSTWVSWQSMVDRMTNAFHVTLCV